MEKYFRILLVFIFATLASPTWAEDEEAHLIERMHGDKDTGAVH